jgi:hypothetical protein
VIPTKLGHASGPGLGFAITAAHACKLGLEGIVSKRKDANVAIACRYPDPARPADACTSSGASAVLSGPTVEPGAEALI